MHSGSRPAGSPPPEPPTARASGLLSPGERALWFLHRLVPGSAAYNLAGALRIAHLSPSALRRAVLRLVERHAALRTTFPADHGEPFRRVQGWLEPEIVEEDAAGLADEGLACEEIRGRFEAEVLRPFDPEHGPLLRVRIFHNCGPGGGGAALFVFHHLIADFWSLTVILRELGELYGEETGGAPAELLPPPAPYEQWVERQTLELAGEHGEALRTFWTERLAGPVPVLDLPADRPRPAQPSGAGVGGSGRLGPGVTACLQALARERRTTLFAAVLAGFQLLLHRISGDEEIWVGVPAAGRGAARWARTVGYFVNPVVLRGRPGAATVFEDLLDRAAAESEEALSHRGWPFAWLAEELHPVRDAGRMPLFQAMLVLYRTRYLEEEPLALLALGEGGGKARLGGLDLETLPLGRRGAQLDVSLTAAVVAGELRLRLELDADRFDAATARRLLDHLEALLAAAAERLKIPLDDLPLLSGAERQALLLEWNDPRAAAPVEGSLDGLVAAQAERTPQATALVCAGRRLSYRELMDRAEPLARRLRTLGAGPEVRVGICAGRSPELVIGILAILRAGAAYVPLDPALPRERLAWILEDSGAALLLTESSRLDWFPGGPPMVVLGEETGRIGPIRPIDSDPHRLAYVLYTSGSTGRPKGVALEHAGALALLRWAGEVFADGELSGVVASTSIGFDLSVFELFLPLSRGGAVLLVPDALQAGAAPGATLINTVPSAMAELVRLGAVPASVRVVCLAGERLPGSLAAAVRRAAPGCRLLNLYGPTESTTYATWFEVEPEDGREPAIGRPVDGTRVHLLDRQLRPLPVGVAGELFLAGLGLARGYAGRPDLTAERFVPDPWSPEPGGRLYRTGDLGRRRPDGVLEILGRVDQQVKLRGVRIELGEVEAALASHPAVREAVAEVRADAAGDRRLVAWVAGATGDPDPAALREHLAARLPGPMVPAVFAPLAALPLTPNGKVDRRALAARALPEEGPAAGWVPPRSSMEDWLAGAFAEVLGRRLVGARDDFFALGGHSLLATRLLARVRTAFGVDLPLRTVFTSPTVARLAEAVAAARRGGFGRPAETAPLARVPRTGPLPLSSSQRRLWVLHRITPGLTAYHIPAGLRLRGLLDAGALELALGEIVRRHAALRTSFPLQDSDQTPSPRGERAGERGMGSIEPVQAVAPFAGVSLPCADLSSLPEDRRQGEARRIADAETGRPFDPERGPLLRLLRLRLAGEEHVLLLVVHHLVSDGWSMAIFLRELSILYAAFRSGLPSPLPEPELQYADWALWQRDALRSEALEAQLLWWRDRLASAPQVLNLPADFPRPPLETYAGSAVPVRLPEALVEGVRRLGRGEDGSATLFMVLLAAFQALLARWSGDRTVCTGTHVAGRDRVEIEDLIGFFVNTLVIRTDLDRDPSGRELIARVRDSVLGAFAHQDVPFEKVVEAVNPPRDLRFSPLFQVAFTLQNAPREDLRLPGLQAETLDVVPGTSPYDLSLTLWETGEGIAGGLQYRTALFVEPTARRLVSSWETLLRGLVAEPLAPFSELPLLTGPERQALLVEWNDALTAVPAAGSLDALVAARAALAPQATALVCDGRRLTCGELMDRVERLAGRLRSAGAGPEARVGICAGRSPELVIGILAILRSGAAYVPLDPAHPRERLAWTLEDSGAALLLAESSRLGLFSGGPPAVLLDGEGEIGPIGPGPTGSDPRRLAYVLYTSGSTGRPKGVGVSHENVLNFFAGMDAVLRPEISLSPWGEGRGEGHGNTTPGTWLAVTSASFDISVLELLWTLARGFTVVLADEDPGSLAVPLRRHRVTHLQCTPSMARVLAADPAALEALGSLHVLLLGGEALPPALAARLPRPPGGILNLYGPTETTIWSSVYAVPSPPRETVGGAVPIGRPIANTSIHVVDPASGSLQPKPPGSPGELVIGGAGVARGYLGRPELTAERFVPDPFAAAPGSRLYRTGDLARFLADGTLEFHGRIDQQVKVRGFRVELGEVESVLAAHPSVREAIAEVRADASGDRRLVAWVAGRGGDPDAGALRDFLAARLPGPMVPSVFAPLPALPVTPNGKVDRRALAARPLPEEGPAAGYVPPRNSVEDSLAAVFAEVLGRERVGAQDDFFALGGHSLLATRVLARVGELFRIDLPLRDLFEAPTPTALAERLRSTARGRTAPPIRRGAAGEPGEPAVLSFAQERFWFLHRLEPDTPAYNVAGAVRIRGPLRPPALEGALGEIVRRHEVLRTRFPEVAGAPAAVVDPPVLLPFPLPLVDLAALPRERCEAAAERLASEIAAAPFDLSGGPLFCGVLVRLCGEEHDLLVAAHHIVADGASIDLFFHELATLYRRPGELPELPVQYSDYARWQRSWLTGEVLEARLAWWEKELAGAPTALDLPTDRPRSAASTSRGGLRAIALPPALAEKLDALRRPLMGTRFMSFAAVFQTLLGRLAGQGDVLIGTPVSERSRRELEPLIGCLINTLVLRGRMADDPTFEEQLRRIRATSLAIWAHQDLPFERLVERLPGARDAGRTPLFQALLTSQAERETALELGDAAVALRELDSGAAKLDLSLTLEKEGPGLRATLRYRSDLFDAPTAWRFLEHFESLLAGGLADPSRRLSELPLLGEAQLHQVLAEWGEGEPARRAELPVHALIRRRADAAPDAPAVFFEGRVALTWRDLRRRSLHLAAWLRRRGAAPGAVVGLSLDRSPDLIVAVLATLETGAAYLPLDPAYPREYLAYVVADSEVSIVLPGDAPLPAPAPGEELQPAAGPPLAPDDWPEAWAYVLYTSGSTGKPKGTPVTHRALLNYLEWSLDGPLAGTDGVLFVTSLNFDASLKQLFAPLLQGQAVRLVSDESARRPERLLGHLGRDPREAGRLALNCVPSLWRALLDLLEAGFDPDPGGPRPAAARVPALVRLLLGGEGFDRDLVERTQRLLPEVEIWNLYGPTEATANASAARLAGGDPLPPGIGRPLRGVRLHVLDPFFGPVPQGTVGELMIGGAGVAPGYWRRPELTAERFVPDPFAGRAGTGGPGARLFRTGDLARWRADGSLELQGRIDRQLKIRGLRIEPGEVEAALASHPAVAECVVGTDPEGARLVAWVVARSGSALLAEELRRHLEGLLPPSLVPAVFVLLDAMPRLPNGKVSHATLPPPEAPPRTAAVAPRSPAEEVLAWLWCEVLELPAIGIHDDFFERGGHSLLATRLLARVRAVFGVDLPLRTVFAVPTVARLAEAIAAVRRSGPDGRREAVPVEPVPRTGLLPLSFAQERLWFIDQWSPQSPAYNIPAAVRLRGPLDAGALAAALAGIVRRHETLRTTFSAAGGQPMQVIHSGMEIPLPVIDLSGAAGTGATWRTLAVEEARRGFDLQRGPLLRTLLLRLTAADHVLVVNLHHIVSDGWSMGVLIGELRALYAVFREGGREGRPLPLLPLPVQYVDYAVWQHRLVEGASDLEWWRGFLAGAPAALELPADRPRPPWSIHRGAIEPVALPPVLTARLHRLARQADATLFMVLLASFDLLLARLAGVEDLVVGTAVAQRTPEVERLIGLFVNLLPLRSDLSGDPPFSILLARTRFTTLEAHDHQDVPFERLVATLEPLRDPGRHPLFQAALALQNAPMPEAILPGLELEIEPLDTGTARFDLTLLLQERDGGLAGALEHSADLFDRATMLRLLGSFVRLLVEIAEDPGRPISHLSLLSAAERRQILEVWSRPSDRTDPSDALTLHQLFARQVARTPDAVALVDLGVGRVEITYRELDRRSALLARRLRMAGAAPDVPVAVLLERSADMVVALLGILRAGAAYVPLDLGYPRERLAWMLEDSGARLVVTRGAAMELLGAPGLEVVPIDDLAHQAASETVELPPVSLSPDNLAYVLYTSGSTGRPKGAAVPQRAVARLVIAPDYVELGPRETILQLAPVPFDASTFEIWGALLNGGRLAVFPPGPVSLHELATALSRHQVTTVFLTAGLFHQMMDEEPEGLSGLSQLIAGGDVVSVAHARAVLEKLPGCRLSNGYGPTEATTFALCHPVAAADTERPTLALGRPIARTSVWLFDDRLEPVPPGVPGELYLGGDGLARGYWRRPDQTAGRFVPHPFPSAPGERLYRTGDLGRWLPDGTVAFLGRIDRQVKIRGFRVEPAEIEATLERHPRIAVAVVEPRDDGRGNKRLVAWIVPASPEAPGLSDAELIAWSRSHLPSFMVPGAFVAMVALPLDPNGKVDRKVLPDPDRGPHGRFVAPRTPVEEEVAAVWAEVLGLGQVGAEDNFFELGGHSLLATRIVARLTRDFGVELGLRELFDDPTVAGVALAVTRAQIRQEDPERIEQLLGQVRDLSPDELARLVGEEGV